MADYNTITTYNGNGTTTDFAIPFEYLNEADVVVTRQNGSVTYSFLNPSMIRINAPLAVGDVLTIQRVTDLDPAAVTFNNGSVITAGQLNAGFNQTLYAAQEANDKVNKGLFPDTLNRLDAQNRRMINLADPVSDQDAVTKKWAETAGASFVSQAGTSATNAAASATASGTSATNAAASASSASDKASEAAASAASASTSATNAAASATAASGSASAASTSAGTATTKASEASTSATNAAASATSASTSATNAANSASSAAASAAAAATALDNFDDRYLGQKASDPTLDNDGNALLTGALYFNTTNRIMRVYDGTQWLDASSATPATMKTYTFIATAGQTVFSGADANSATLSFTSPYLIVSLNGVELRPTTDYTTSGSGTITLTSAASVNDEIQIQAFRAFEVANLTAGSVGFTQAGTGATARNVEAKLREIASVDDFGGSLSTALSNATSTSPVLTGLGGVYLPGYNVIDPGSLLTTSMLPSSTKGRAPLFIMNNPSATDLVDGYAAGIYVHIGNNPSATPAAGDTVAQTITVNNLNGRTHLWGSNTVVLQDASGADGMVRAAEFEVNNVKGFNANPFSGSAPYRKNGIEIVGHSSSTYKLTAAITFWANDSTGTGWFDQGLVLSRVASKGIRFVKDPNGGTDTGTAFATAAISDESNSNATLSVSGTHGSIIDLSGNPSYSQFILGKGNADTTVSVKNGANYSVGLSLDSGNTATQSSFVDFSDKGTPKWRIVKNNGNGFFIISDPLGSPVTVAEFSPGGGGALGIGRTPSYGLDVNGSACFRSSVGFNGTAPLSKPTVTGSKGGNAALASLITALANYGLIIDSTT